MVADPNGRHYDYIELAAATNSSSSSSSGGYFQVEGEQLSDTENERGSALYKGDDHVFKKVGLWFKTKEEEEAHP